MCSRFVPQSPVDRYPLHSPVPIPQPYLHYSPISDPFHSHVSIPQPYPHSTPMPPLQPYLPSTALSPFHSPIPIPHPCLHYSPISLPQPYPHSTPMPPLQPYLPSTALSPCLHYSPIPIPHPCLHYSPISLPQPYLHSTPFGENTFSTQNIIIHFVYGLVRITQCYITQYFDVQSLEPYHNLIHE